MPRKTKSPVPEQSSVPEIPKEFLDQIVSGPMTSEAVEAVMRKFKKAVIERALGGELTHHLGYLPGAARPDDTGNHRNGTSVKTVLTDDGALRIDVPRDRQGSFEPQLIGKHERRFTGFDDKIIAMYARGMHFCCGCLAFRVIDTMTPGTNHRFTRRSFRKHPSTEFSMRPGQALSPPEASRHSPARLPSRRRCDRTSQKT